MKEATAQLNNYRASPRKVRVVADAIRGKSVSQAKNVLNFLTKRSTGPLQKLLNSAVANAKSADVKPEDLVVKSISVNVGKILYRRRPAAHGASHPLRKRTSHIQITLAEKVVKEKKEKNIKK